MGAAEKIPEQFAALVRSIVLAVLEEQRHATPANEPAMLTRSECARALNISVTTLDRAIRGGCPKLTIGRAVRFDPEAVRAWMNANGRRPIRQAKPTAITTAMLAEVGLRKR